MRALVGVFIREKREWRRDKYLDRHGKKRQIDAT